MIDNIEISKSDFLDDILKLKEIDALDKEIKTSEAELREKQKAVNSKRTTIIQTMIVRMKKILNDDSFETTKVVRFISEGVLYTITSKKADFEIKKDHLTFK